MSASGAISYLDYRASDFIHQVTHISSSERTLPADGDYRPTCGHVFVTGKCNIWATSLKNITVRVNSNDMLRVNKIQLGNFHLKCGYQS